MNLTIALAHSSNPPMGANIMPTTKKSGSTVFGVRIGLDSTHKPSVSFRSYVFLYDIAELNVRNHHLLPCFQPLLPECSIWNSV